MEAVKFLTSEECRCELVAHTTMRASLGGESWPESAGFLPVSAARASFQNEDRTGNSPDKDIKLLKSLTRDEHVGPFEHNHATFIIECPLFIRSQIMRHRTGAYNEWSRRYTSEKIGFWIPDKWRAQSKSNRQVSTDEEVFTYFLPNTPGGSSMYNMQFKLSADDLYGRSKTTKMHDTGHHTSSLRELYLNSLYLYEAMLKEGVCREQARAVLPQSLLTQFFMTMNLRNWVHFLRLRLDSHAQVEVQIVARKIESQLRDLWPEAMGVLLPIEES